MWEINIFIQTDSTSPRTLDRSYGYLIECTTQSGALHKAEGEGKITGTLHQAALTAVNEALGRLNQSCIVHIYTEDRFICNMFSTNIDKWAANEWKTSKNSEVENREEWERLFKLTRGQLIRMIPGKHKYSDWMITKMKAEGLKPNLQREQKGV